MSIASRMAAQAKNRGGSTRQTTRGGTTYKRDRTGKDVTPTPFEIYIQQEKIYDTRYDYDGLEGNEGYRGRSVSSDEYIKHHAESFGTSQNMNLAAGLDNCFGESFDVIEPRDGVTVIVDGESDTVHVISDVPLDVEEKEGYRRTIDKAGDTPNETIFIEGDPETTPAPVIITNSEEGAERSNEAVSSGGASMILILVAGAVGIVILMMGRR